ncbi:MAG: IS200/IS605 family transposase [Chloroflexota bacterium]
MPSSYVIYYHIIWATKNRTLWITPTIETLVLNAIKEKSHHLQSPIHGINTMPDHIHVAVTIPPSLSVAKWVQDIKGLSAYKINYEFPDREETFKWQKGYSVRTFGAKALPFVLNYINRQKEHHQNNTLEDYLEYLDG